MKNTHRLTEGAILLAAFAVLLLITIYVPVIGMVVNLFLPVPFILFAAKNDWKSIVVFVITSLLLSLVVGSIVSLPLTLAYGTTGAVMGAQIRRKKGKMTMLVAGSLVFLVNIILIYAVSIYFFKVDMIQQLIDLFRESLKTSNDMLAKMGQAEQSKKMTEQFNTVLDLMKTLIPTLFVISSFFIVLIIQAVSQPIVKRFGIQVEHFKPFREMILPKSVLWYFLLVLAANLFFRPPVGSYWQMAIVNLTYILYFLMVFQGYSFMFYFFHQKGMSKSSSIVIAILAFIIPIMLYIIGILGIMDLGFDLRKRIVKKE